MKNESDFVGGLSEREQLVMAYLVQYPEIPDFELALKIGIKRSTFSTIKKRLKAKKYYTLVYLPNVAYLNIEFITLNIRVISELSSYYGVSDSSDEKKSVNFLDILKNSNRLLFSAVESNLALTLSCYENYNKFEEISDQLENNLLNLGINFSFQQELHFPIRLSEFPRFLDYSKSLFRLFGLSLEEKLEKPIFLPPQDPQLRITQVGQEILYSFLEAPGRTPREVSQLTGRPRTTTTRWLKKLVDSGVIVPRLFPNTKKLGLNILLLCRYCIISSQASTIEMSLSLIDKVLTPIILMRFGFDVIVTAVFSSFEEAKVAETHLISLMSDNDILFNVEYRNFLSLPHTITTLDYMDSFMPILTFLGETEQTS
ncbi:hypothetical protein CEE45_04725 [Candidatus Heimdallarchaeota archaeon B3_Heim]|nr:MAG: hypothetical protein CEE45_04725 [Candidatus Heimdallarchaeota archaeon B3_Heim]